MRSIQLFRLLNDTRLQGQIKGEAHLPRLAESMALTGALVLDFSEIEALTSSYFFAALWPFWTREDATGPSIFPLVGNAVRDVEDELAFVMNHRRTSTWYGKWDGHNFVPTGRLGVLDPPLASALDRAVATGGITAVDLAEGDETKATAWNNRLINLHKQRLLRRQQLGRRAVYFIPWEGPSVG